MPTYEYACQACEHQFEQFQSITASPIRKCPACGKLKVKRKIGTGAGIIFKGSGFYQTDYRSDGYRKSAAADTGSSSSSSTPSGSASKTETTKSDTSSKKSDSDSKAAG